MASSRLLVCEVKRRAGHGARPSEGWLRLKPEPYFLRSIVTERVVPSSRLTISFHVPVEKATF